MAYIEYPERRQGIYSDLHKTRQGYPLLSSRYEYTVDDILVKCTLTESYKTQATSMQQISYSFEIPPEASVVGFDATVGDVKVKAVIEEKHRASKIYHQAVTTGVQAWKLDKLNGEVFIIGLGNAPPASLITITVRYLHLISSDSLEDSVRLTVPAGLTPRPNGSPSAIATTPTAVSGGNAVTITVGIYSGRENDKILNLHCLSHHATITWGHANESYKTMTPTQQGATSVPGRAYVEFTSKTFLKSHFVLVWSIPRIDVARCLVQQLPATKAGEPPTSAFALTVVSNVKLEPDEHEYIFLVDSSGSMSGSRTTTAQDVVKSMLQQLPNDKKSTFNVYSFNTNAWSIIPGGKSIGYDISTSTNFQLPNTASGGTNIKNALDTVLAQRNTSKPRCSIIVVTDGLDWGVEAAIHTIQKAVTKAAAESKLLRVFVMGLGDHVSMNMCESLARAGSGATVYIGQSQLLEKDHQEQKARNMINAINRAPIRVRSIDWGMTAAPDTTGSARTGSFESSRPQPDQHQLGPAAKGDNLGPPKAIQQSPNPGTMFWAVRSYWYAIIRGKHPNQPFNVTIKYDVPGRANSRHKKDVEVSSPSGPGKRFHQLAARALIQTLEDEALSITDAEQKYWKEAEIVRLGKTYGLASSQTSFIATMNGVGTISHIDRNKPSDGSRGHHASTGVRDGEFSLDFVNTSSPIGTRSAPTRSANTGPFNPVEVLSNARSFIAPQVQSLAAATPFSPINMFAFQQPVNSRSAPQPEEASGDDDIVSKIAVAQNDDGSFDEALVEQTVFPNTGIPAIPAFLSILQGATAMKNRIWLAVCTVAFLQEQHGGQEGQWASIRAKAEAFIRQSLSSIFGVGPSALDNIVSQCLDDAGGYFF